MAQSSPSHLTLQQPRIPVSFHGAAFEDVDDWLDQYERVATFNQWSPEQKLRSVYVVLEDGAKTWFENREADLQSWDNFREQVRDTLASTDHRDRARGLLEARVQKPNQSVAMFAEDMIRLFRRVDPDMAEAARLRHLMQGVNDQLFAGLVRNTYPPDRDRLHQGIYLH